MLIITSRFRVFVCMYVATLNPLSVPIQTYIHTYIHTYVCMGTLSGLSVATYCCLASLRVLSPLMAHGCCACLACGMVHMGWCNQAMEKAVAQLEQRLLRREQELAAAVDDAKAAQRLERSRMEALHAQVCLLLHYLPAYLLVHLLASLAGWLAG